MKEQGLGDKVSNKVSGELILLLGNSIGYSLNYYIANTHVENRHIKS